MTAIKGFAEFICFMAFLACLIIAMCFGQAVETPARGAVQVAEVAR